MTVDHPFENGRLIVWIDGVLVYETKLQASVSKKIVAFKVREGRVETLLDVEPGPHQVRVEVTWDQERRVSTKVIDVAAASTGLLEVRVPHEQGPEPFMESPRERLSLEAHEACA